MREGAGGPVVFLLFGLDLFYLGLGEVAGGFFDEFAASGDAASVVTHDV